MAISYLNEYEKVFNNKQYLFLNFVEHVIQINEKTSKCANKPVRKLWNNTKVRSEVI